jgi:hypothetical protein
MLAIYPGSTVEVVFQQLKTRPPFDDPAMRSELRTRLNQAAGIDIPLAKLELRPSFRVSELADPATERILSETLAWFVSNARQNPDFAQEESADDMAGVTA